MRENRIAIIIGAGIGGLAAGIALKRIGMEVEIYERAPEIRPVGAGIVLWANALKALALLGAYEAIHPWASPYLSGGIRSWKGEMLAAISSEDMLRRFGEPAVAVHRADLHAALCQVLGEEVIHLGKDCTGYEQDCCGVAAHFADGSQAHGDLLVGADGLRSAVRAQLVGSARPAYAGYTAWRGVAHFDLGGQAGGESWGRGARFGIVPMSGGRVYWFATANSREGEQDPPGASRKELLARFRGWHKPVEALVQATAEEDILRNDIYDRPPLKQWSEKSITLLGDAAHAMTPNMGQGACQAIEDAVVLAGCLRVQTTIILAFQDYENRRIPRTSAIAKRSRQIGQVGQWQNPLSCWLRDRVLKILPASAQFKPLEDAAGYEVAPML